MPLFDKKLPVTNKAERYDILKFLVSERLTQKTIDSIPKQYLSTALTIFYMFEVY